MFYMEDMPNSVKREMEKLNETIAPLAKKASKYTFLSIPLVSISILNLFVLLMIVPRESYSLTALFIYAVIGAVGMALSKEAKIHRQEIQQISSTFIIERIEKSRIASDHMKKEYISLVKKQPVMALKHFVAFLEKEEHQAHHEDGSMRR